MAWIGELVAAAPVVLTDAEEAAVTAAVTAIAWSLTAGRVADVGDAVVA
ncbi:MAG: hypothetical protein HS111_18970 [Kofleriaceae bacterium]|nr:hypothetical protein [Kofleriaceae bacterium]